MSLLNSLTTAFPDHKIPNNRWMNINCPFCEITGRIPDRKYKLGLNYKKGYIHCFRCGRVHRIAQFLKLVNVDIDLTEFSNEDSEPVSYFVPTTNTINFPNEYINILDLYDDRYSVYLNALEYIDKRVGIDLAVKLNVGFCATGDYANRIIVPVFDLHDNIIYFAARSIFPFLEPKIKNPPGFRKSILFNWNIAQKFSEIFIMEGIFGALTVYPYGIATLGKEITDEQIYQLLRSDIKIINIVLDNNAIPDAYKIADRICKLTRRIKIRVLELRAGQPDDFTFDFLLALKDNTQFYIRRLF
jgi:hypothetical protein